jgi:hypothetical protein
MESEGDGPQDMHDWLKPGGYLLATVRTGAWTGV